jgi:hypothetical protein
MGQVQNGSHTDTAADLSGETDGGLQFSVLGTSVKIFSVAADSGLGE